MITFIGYAEAKKLGKAFRSKTPRGDVILVAGPDDLNDETIWATAVDVGASYVYFVPDADPTILQRVAELAVAPKVPTP